MKLDVEIDTAMNYTIYEKIGDLNYRPTSSMSFEEFQRHQDRSDSERLLAGTFRKHRSGESAVSGRGSYSENIYQSNPGQDLWRKLC